MKMKIIPPISRVWEKLKEVHTVPLTLADSGKIVDYSSLRFLLVYQHEAKTDASVLNRLVHSSRSPGPRQEGDSRRILSAPHQGWSQHGILFVQTAVISFAGIRMR